MKYFGKRKTGGTIALTYGILVAGLAVASIGSVSNLGQWISDKNHKTIADLKGAPPTGGPASCYDPANTGKIGEAGWTGCEGMYIISQVDWTSIACNFDEGGACAHQIIGPDAQTYTTENTTRNIFTGIVTDFSYSFAGVEGQTPGVTDIAYLDTSNGTSFVSIFEENGSFNGDLSSWDVSSVTTMSNAFRLSAFTQPLETWNVGAVQVFFGMFRGTAYNQDVSGWNIASATNMSHMFNGAASYNQDLSGWSVDGVTACTDFSLNATSWAPASKPTFANCTP